jgi:hypothetical protein
LVQIFGYKPDSTQSTWNPKNLVCTKTLYIVMELLRNEALSSHLSNELHQVAHEQLEILFGDFLQCTFDLA